MTPVEHLALADCGTCAVCGGGPVEEVVGFRGLRRVTSDCREWPSGGRLGVCAACGAVQKPADERFLEEIRGIYETYAIYHQAQGAEQAVFDQSSGLPASRSLRLVQAFRDHMPLAATGRVLDVGCGNGAMLRAFSAVLPGWRLIGTELDDKYRKDVESIPNAEPLHVGPVEQVAGVADVITLIHALEHMIDPVAFLESLLPKLAHGGVLLIEVPHHPENPFELLIADHRSHFTAATLCLALDRAGYEPVITVTGWVSKELSVVARPATSGGRSGRKPTDPASARSTVESSLAWLGRTVAAARGAACGAPIGLFGTSIAGTWLCEELGQAVGFFVDEDPNRAGAKYLGRPILPPAAVPAGSTVFVGLPPALASDICRRLARPDVLYIPPPS